MKLTTPNANNYRGDSAYLSALVRDSGLSQEGCAKRIGVSPRTLRRYLHAGNYPYTVQYALERLAHGV